MEWAEEGSYNSIRDENKSEGLEIPSSMVLGIAERLAALAKLLIAVSSKRYEEASIQPAGKSINSAEI